MDLTPITKETMRKDHNGVTAALVKIETTLGNLSFGGSGLGVVEVEQKPGQWWLYIPERSRKIVIAHPKHGIVEYVYDAAIEPGKTYSMKLTFEGRDISIEASVPKAELCIDDEPVGISPKTIYLPYGIHPIKAVKGNMVYTGSIDVTPDGDRRFHLPMEDERLNYGKVTIITLPDADIYFAGAKVGVGSWSKWLAPGEYTVETRRDNADASTTPFTVSAREEKTVEATAPVPHTGFLKLNIMPYGTEVDDDGELLANPASSQLTVGSHLLTFRKEGYETKERLYDIRHNVETIDDVSLTPVEFVKRNTVYGGVFYNWSSMSGCGIALGVVFQNVDIHSSYTIGLGKTEPVAWFSKENNVYEESCEYSLNTLDVKLGYQLLISKQFAVTPQLGFRQQTLSTAGEHGNGVGCLNLTVGVKLLYEPVKHFGIFATGDYAMPVQKNQTFSQIARNTSVTEGGIGASIGVLFNL